MKTPSSNRGRKRRPLTILVVDDDRDLVDLTARHLESSGHRVLRAYDGMEAIRSAHLNQPDLILLDIMMPGLDGFQVCRFLKNHPGLERIPVFFMTARDGAGDRQRGLLRGGDDYLTKPLDFHEVAGKIGRLRRSSAPGRLPPAPAGPPGELSEITAIRELGRMLDENLYHLSIMEEVSRAVVLASSREEIVRALLAGCLGDIGLGFDRALFLEKAEDGSTLACSLALGDFSTLGAGPGGHRGSHRRLENRTLRELLSGNLAGIPFLRPEKHPRLSRFVLSIPGGRRRYDQSGAPAGDGLAEAARILSAEAAVLLGSPGAQAFPVVAHGELIGALVVDTPSGPRGVSAEDRRNLLILCNQVGLALERVRLQEEQRLQSLRLEHLSQINAGVISAAGVGIALLDPQGVVLAWNPTMARLAGIAADQAMGRRLMALLPALEGSLLERRLRRTLRERIPERVGHFPLAVGGRNLSVDWKITPVRTPDGLQGAVAVAEDITRRMSLEEKNREILQHLRDIIDGSADAILIADGRGRIRSINSSAQALLGRTQEELKGRGLGFLFAGSGGRKGLAQLLNRVSRGEADRDRELVFHAPDGEHRYLSITSTPIRRAGGGVRAISLVARDISERRKLIAQLVQTEKLASLGVIAAGMAHEINNPLTSISMHAQLLSMACGLDREGEGYVDKIMEEVSRISEIVGDLLVYSRSQTRAREAVDVGEVLRQAVTFIRRKTSADGIAVDFETEGDLPAIQGRANEILEIFLNILSNAADAVPREGNIRVRAGCVRGAGGESREPQLKVLVRDDGTGIPSGDLPRIFDPFYTTKPPGKGTGLGLMVVKELVESYGGGITVDSRQGRGTTVTVLLPCTQAGGRETAKAPGARGRRGPGAGPDGARRRKNPDG